MKRTISASQDFLGIVAIGSIIGNLLQANEMSVVKKQAANLNEIYRNIVERYKLLYREYEAFRQVNEQLRREVVALRTENSKLLQRIASKETAR